MISFDMCDLRDKRFEKCATGEVIGNFIWDVIFEKYAIGKIFDWRFDLRDMRLEICAKVIGEVIGND